MKSLTNSRILITVFLVLLLTACNSSNSISGAEKTLIVLDVYSTLTAEAKADGSNKPSEPDEPSEPSEPDTPAPADTNTPLPPPTDPPAAPTNTPVPPEATPDLTAVAYANRVQDMKNEVQDLANDGYLNSTAGSYKWLPNYTDSLAQINFVKKYLYNLEITEFVMRGTVAWETAAEGANIKNSGCGFMFGYHDDGAKYHILLFSLDGNVKLFRLWNKTYIEAIGSGYYGSVDYLEGSVELTLVVEDNKIQGFVNGKQIFSRADQKVREGLVGYAFSSGTNTGFGTRCTFTDVSIWVLDQ